MKPIIIVLTLISGMASKCQSIDQCQTTEDVIQFIEATYPDYKPSAEQPLNIKSTATLAQELNCDGLFKDWNVQNWEKADLNNDGRTDLLVILDYYGHQTIAILDLGNKQYHYETLRSNPFDSCQLVKPIRIADKTYLKYSHNQAQSGRNRFMQPKKVVDTMTFYNTNFIAYNPNPPKDKITKISFQTSACFGTCPEYTLDVNSSTNVTFNGTANTPVIGKTSFNLKNGEFQELEDLLNYANIKNLKDDYAVSWTDDQTGVLTVTFADGSSKRISDYGLQGTFGLKAVYKKLSAIANGSNAQ